MITTEPQERFWLRNTKVGQIVTIPPWGAERVGGEDAREKGKGEEDAKVFLVGRRRGRDGSPLGRALLLPFLSIGVMFVFSVLYSVFRLVSVCNS